MIFWGALYSDLFVLLASTYVLIATCVAACAHNSRAILNRSITWNGLLDDLMSYLLLGGTIYSMTAPELATPRYKEQNVSSQWCLL